MFPVVLMQGGIERCDVVTTRKEGLFAAKVLAKASLKPSKAKKTVPL
jgi:hypothetical protein